MPMNKYIVFKSKPPVEPVVCTTPTRCSESLAPHYILKQPLTCGCLFLFTYADIIQYSEDIEADLSYLKVKDFLEEMKVVADESYSVLKKDKFYAVLMGDIRQKGHMIPLSFDVIRVFENAGFKLKELIIKEQHNCKATEYRKTNSVKYNFLLIAHEYLFVFRK